ncbi:MAG: hypothetical protein AAGB04_29730 [Pseudomonadota bacterium]
MIRILKSCALLAALTLALGTPVRGQEATDPVTNASANINWRVENPFRLFTDPADTRRHRASFEALSEEEKQTPVLSVERQLAKRHPDGWAAELTGELCWNEQTYEYRCKRSEDKYIRPTSHRIEAWLDYEADLTSAICAWLTTPRGRNQGRGIAVTQPCDRPIELDVPYPAGALVEVRMKDRQLARQEVRVKDIFVVGLGDSFASGEGNPDVPVRFSRERSADYGAPTENIQLAGYPARVGGWRKIGDRDFIKHNAKWLDQACHRSLYSHQLRTALQLAIEDPHRAVTYLGYACSGAEITKGLFLRYKGNEWVPKPPALSQLSAVARAQCGERTAPLKDYPEAFHMREKIPDLKGSVILHKCPRDHARKIDLLLVSVGGNDIGFARLVANAVLRDKSVLKRLGGWFGQVFDKRDANEPLKNLDYRYKALNRAIHNVLHVPWNQSDRIILTAYPPLALLDDGRTPCPDGRLGMEILPAYRLDAARAREGEDVSATLNKFMRRHARGRGWTFADHHRETFVGHGLCAGAASAGLSMADELRLPRLIDGYWQPYNPANYKAYTRRKRWYRTPNDAFMTGHFHVTGSLLQSVLRSKKLRWTQLLLASTYSGAFHPTAEGQAAIADAVVHKARAVLRKYDKRRGRR